MYLPPLQPVVNSNILIIGDVEIHPTASVASGVILQAAPQSRIIIGADVCIGMGVVLNACGGVIDIESGATLGAGVLIIGKSKVGSNSCVGTSTTIFNASVESMKVITPGSILENASKAIASNSSTNVSGGISSKIESPQKENSNGDYESKEEPKKSFVETTSKKQKPTEINSKVNGYVSNNHDVADLWSEEKPENQAIESVATIRVAEVAEVAKNIEASDGIAIGKVYIDQLLVTLFPHKQSSNDSS